MCTAEFGLTHTALAGKHIVTKSFQVQKLKTGPKNDYGIRIFDIFALLSPCRIFYKKTKRIKFFEPFGWRVLNMKTSDQKKDEKDREETLELASPNLNYIITTARNAKLH